jgi:hypothetical protein
VSIANLAVPLYLNTSASVFAELLIVKSPTSTVQSSLAPICIDVVPDDALVALRTGESTLSAYTLAYRLDVVPILYVLSVVDTILPVVTEPVPVFKLVNVPPPNTTSPALPLNTSLLLVASAIKVNLLALSSYPKKPTLAVLPV